jgi:hypothetical protein
LINVAALVSSVEGLEIQTAEELRDAIFVLDLANMCIRLLVGEIGRGKAREHLLAQSARIDQLIDVARSEVAQL